MNTRNSFRNQYQSARYNTTGTFTPATQQTSSESQYNQQSQQEQWPSGTPASSTTSYTSPLKEDDSLNVDIANSNNDSMDEGSSGRKKWMKKGFKVSMRERRRRQNRQLRKLLTPKNALVVLNELAPGSHHECTVVPDQEQYSAATGKQYVAVLNVGGIEYKGVGNSKLQAKNNAAEPIIRDMIIKHMGKLPDANNPDEEKMDTAEGIEGSEETEGIEGAEDEKSEEQSFPMIQLASYALHKLFSDWQQEGFKVPQLAPNKAVGVSDKESVSSAVTTGGPKTPKKAPSLPPNPAHLHPCMLLSQMRGALPYNFLACEGVKPNSQIFTISVIADGTTYIGKAANKKEARKMAAKKACEELFQIVYPEDDKKVAIEDM